MHNSPDSDVDVQVPIQSTDDDDAGNAESDSESCLRPRSNRDAASPLKLPSKIVNILFCFIL